MLGLMIGSLLCEKFIGYGRIKVIYTGDILVMISVIPQMWLTLTSLIIGRFIMGFGCSLAMVSCSIFMAETVPASKLGFVGTAVNSGIIFALLLTTIIQGASLPNTDDDQKI